MKQEEFKTEFPHTFECLKILSYDNGMVLREEFVRAEDIINLPFVELLASSINQEQKEVLCAGEETEMLTLVADLAIQELHEFLTEVFDGNLHDIFWEN